MKIKLYKCSFVRDADISTENYLGIGYLKTNCKNAIVEVEKHKKNLKDCDLIAISCFNDGIKEAIDIAEKSDIPVIVGGPASEWSGLADYNFKHIVVGEGEIAFQSIIDGNETEKIVSKPLIEDLDILNFPDRGKCGEIIPITLSRGCHYKCKFCGTPNLWKRYRSFSPEYSIKEVEYILNRYPQVTTLAIFDNLFIGCRDKFYKFYDLWMSKGFNKRLKIEGSIRSNIFDYELASKLKNMGVHRLSFGFESGSDRVLNMIDKKTTVQHNQKAIDICNLLEITVHGCFMYNIPGETMKEIAATRKFIWDNRHKMPTNTYSKFIPLTGYDSPDDQNVLNLRTERRNIILMKDQKLKYG